MRFEIVQRPHWLLTGTTRAPSRLPAMARNFWSNWCLPAQRAVIGWGDDEIVGFFRYDPESGGNPMWALGTWLHPHWRGAGLARRLWAQALLAELPEAVHVGVVSKTGEDFAVRLTEIFPGIAWELEKVS